MMNGPKRTTMSGIHLMSGILYQPDTYSNNRTITRIMASVSVRQTTVPLFPATAGLGRWSFDFRRKRICRHPFFLAIFVGR